MTVVNKIERTVWNSKHVKFEIVTNPYSPYYLDSIPNNLTKSRNNDSFVVEWQMTKEGGMPVTKRVLKSY